MPNAPARRARRLRAPVVLEEDDALVLALLPRRLRLFARTDRTALSETPYVNLERHVLMVNLGGPGYVVIDDAPCHVQPG